MVSLADEIAAVEAELDALGYRLERLDSAAVMIERAKADTGPRIGYPASKLAGVRTPDAASSPTYAVDAGAIPQWAVWRRGR